MGWEAKAIATMQKEEPRRDDRRLARQGEVRIDRSEIQDDVPAGLLDECTSMLFVCTYMCILV